MKKASRNTDSRSSHKAEYDITASGERVKQADIVLEAIQSNPGKTSKELAEYCNLDRYQIARRANDLYQDERVKKIEIGVDELKWYGADTHTEALQSTLNKNEENHAGTDKVKTNAIGLIQVANPCPSCGSFYRRRQKCNKCGQ